MLSARRFPWRFVRSRRVGVFLTIILTAGQRIVWPGRQLERHVTEPAGTRRAGSGISAFLFVDGLDQVRFEYLFSMTIRVFPAPDSR
jgi:hypothetical protein